MQTREANPSTQMLEPLDGQSKWS